RDHPRDQAGNLQVRVDASGLAQVDVLADQPLQTRPLRHPPDRRQSRTRHEVRVIEDGREAMTDSHPADALLLGRDRSLDKIDSPGTEGHPCVTTRRSPQVERWIRAKVRAAGLASRA